MTAHTADFVDETRLWVCTCGASATRHSTIERHVTCANTGDVHADPIDLTPDESIDEGIAVRQDAHVRAVPAVVSRDPQHMRGCPVLESPARLTECNCWPWTDLP